MSNGIAPAHAKTLSAVAEIERWEQNAAKADIAGDASFYRQHLAEDWTDGMSDGSFQTKADLLADLTDRARNITLHETLSGIKVRVYGSTAVATYTENYDALVKGERRRKIIITTDTFTQINGRWVQAAAHSSGTTSHVPQP